MSYQNGIGGFTQGAVQYNHQAADQGAFAAGQQMQDLQKTSALQMKMQTEQGLINMMVKLNEALAKSFKAIGDSIKGLVG